MCGFEAEFCCWRFLGLLVAAGSARGDGEAVWTRPTRSNPLTAWVSGNAFWGVTFQLKGYCLGLEPSSRKLGLRDENLACPCEERAAGGGPGRSWAGAGEEHGAGLAAA